MKKITLKSTRKISILLSLIAFVVSLLLAIPSFLKTAHTTDNTISLVSQMIESQQTVDDISNCTQEDVLSDVFVEASSMQDSGDTNEETYHGWIINNYGYTYIYGDCGYEQFNYKESALNRYVNSINNLASVLPHNSTLYNLTVPVSSTFADIPKEIYVSDNFYNQSQSVFVSTIESKLDPTINNVQLVSLLEQQYDNGEYVYFRTDRNWTQLGAYYAYVAFCESSDIKPYPLDSFVINNQYDYLGSFYNATSLEAMKNNADRLICYGTISSVSTVLTIYDEGKVIPNYRLSDNNVSISNAYDCFLGRSAGRYEINTNVDGNSLLIIGDSSAYPMISFLASHYNKIDIINPEIFKQSLSEFIVGREYNDIIIMCYSTNAINGNFIPSLNIFSGVTVDE